MMKTFDLFFESALAWIGRPLSGNLYMWFPRPKTIENSDAGDSSNTFRLISCPVTPSTAPLIGHVTSLLTKKNAFPWNS